MRLIDADEYLESIKKFEDIIGTPLYMVRKHIEERPTIEIVHCKDCKYRGTSKCVSYEAFWELGDDGYCSCGAKMDEVRK